jgi:Outer membrane protein beta-barrel domain
MKQNYWLRVFLTGTIITAASLTTLSAQSFEVGLIGGGSFHFDKSVTGRSAGKAGFKPAMVVGGTLTHNTAGRWGGEARYQFQKTDLRTSAGGQTATFAGQSHLAHYDVLLYSNSREDSVRPFVAFGGGLRGYRGTGTERAVQPLSNVAILSKVQQWQPMLSFGAGVKWRVGNRLMMRAEVRDFVTPFPKDVIVPSPGNKIGGWIHDFTPMFGVSYLF